MATSAKYRRYNGTTWEDIIFPYSHKHAWSDITSTPTTLSGYGITDAKISNGVITLGGNTITPLTSITSAMVTTALGFTPYNATNPNGYTSNKGTVTKVSMTVPEELVVTGSGITTSGTLAITYKEGYAIPSTADQLKWTSAYNWGNHANQGYLKEITESDVSSLGFTKNTGTVTSVKMTVPTGLSVSGSPITTSGTLAVSLASGYSIPTTAKQANWDTAYGWGDHSKAGYKKTDTNTTYEFTSGTNGFGVKDSDGNTYTISVTPSIGTASSTQNGLMTTTYVTRLNTMWNIWSADDENDSLVNKVQEVLTAFENFPEANNLATLLAGKQPLDSDLTAIAGLSDTSKGFLKKTGSGTWALDTNTYLTTSSASSTYVNLTGAQTISGAKTFTANVVTKNNNFEIKASSNTDDSWIKLTNATDSGYYAFGIRRPYATYGLQMKIHGTDGKDTYYNIWHQGNFTPSSYLTKTAASETYLGINGTALLAKGLTSVSIGSGVQPVYFNASGVPVACTYTLNKSVPSDAKFTDTNTTYSLSKDGSSIILTGSDGSTTSVTDSNNTYTLSSFGVSANATELNYVKGVTSSIQTQITDTQGLIQDLDQSLATVAKTGSYNDLSNKPTIPSAVTETTVSGWGFTKNTGTVTSVKVGSTSYNPTSGVISLPAYPTVPSSLKNPNAINLKVNSETSNFISYDGSAAKTITIKPSTTNGAFIISDGTTNKTIQLAGKFTDNNTNYYHTPSYSSGLSIASGTGVNALYVPIATSSALGVVKSSTTGTTANRDYKVQINTDGTMKVNVPWNNTNTTYTFAATTGGFIATPSSGTAQTVTIPEATEEAHGLMSIEDKTNLNTLVRLLTEEESSTTIDTITEVLNAFAGIGEGTTVANALAGKQNKVSKLGSTSKPVYVSADGTFAETSTYAGGTAVTLNGSGKGGSTASFYAPTGAGTSGYILKSNGSGAPTWVAQSTLNVGSATKATQDGSGNTITATYALKNSLNNYLPLAGGTMTGPISFNGSDSLPSKTLSYICGIDAFAEGGQMGWQSKTDFLSGYATQTWVNNKNYLTSHQTVSNSAPTLAWGTTSTIGTIGGTALTVKMPANPNTDTHHTAYNYVGAADTASNAATTNGNTYLKLYENGTKRSQFKITGSGATTVVSDANGNITISSTDNNTTYSSLAAASGGTAVSLVTTGEKYTWNNKTYTTTIAASTGTNQITLEHGKKYALTAGGTSYVFTMPTANTGDITGVTAGTGLTGGGASGSVTLSVNTTFETDLTNKNYAVSIDSTSGGLYVNVPWQDNNTKNTAGSTDTSSKIFLIGATSQGTNPVTYSHDTAYVGTDGCLYSGGAKVLTEHQSLANYLPLSGGTLTGGLTITAGQVLKFNTINAPTASDGTTYGPGTNGQVLKSNGTTVYWANDSNSTTVRQYTTTTNADYPVIFAYDDSLPNTYETQYVRKSSKMTFNPSTGVLGVDGTINATTLQEGGTSLASKYLGISSTAADSSKLNGQAASYYLNYNNLSNKPTIPTKTSQLTNDSGFLTSHQSLANYVTLNGAQTISGAKTHTALIKTAENTMGLKLRTHDNYETGWVYGTSGNEAITLAMQNPVTAFQIVYGTKPSTFAGGTWQTVTPLFQTKDGKVIINRKIAATADTSSLKLFDVNGDAAATTFYENGTSLADKYQEKGSYVALAGTQEITGNKTFNAVAIKAGKTLTFSATSNSSSANMKWGTVNSKTPYIGYASDQTDGTFVWSITGTAYATGLAIGGGSGNLLWKGTKVATINDIPSLSGYATESFVSNTYATKESAITGLRVSGTTITYTKGNGTEGTITTTDTNTRRAIQVNGTQILSSTSTTALNLKAGSNVTISNSGGAVTISASSIDIDDITGDDIYCTNVSEYYEGLTIDEAIGGLHNRVLTLENSSGGSGGGGLTSGGTLETATIRDFYSRWINAVDSDGTSPGYVLTSDMVNCVNAYKNGELGGSASLPTSPYFQTVTTDYLTVRSGASFESSSNVNFAGGIAIGGIDLDEYILDVVACLMEGTLITMADGSSKRIEEVKEGDLLMSYDFETGKKTTTVCLGTRVGDFKPYYYCLMFDNGFRIKTNWTHDIYNATKGTWTNTDQELELDDEVLTENNGKAKFIGRLEAIGTPNGRKVRFYDIMTSNNCYYADGVLFSHTPTKQAGWVSRHIEDAPTELIDLITSYKNESHRETDLMQKDEYVNQYLDTMHSMLMKESKLRELKDNLSRTDYITLKVSEGIEITDTMQEILDSRKMWRKEFNEVEAELSNVYKTANDLKVKYSDIGEDVLLDSMGLRKKFFLESCKKGNANLNKFKEYYRNSEKYQVDY